MYPPFPPGFQLGPLTIHWYGIFMVTAIFVCALIASRYVTSRGQDSNNIWNMLLWVVIPAIIGARLYYVFIQSPRGPNGLDGYLAHPLEILEVWRGGIHIYGALIGGGIALLIYVSVKKLPALIYLDAVGLGLLLSQAIGRLGNFMNQELYGPPTTLPWGLRIDPAYRLAPYNNLALYPESTRFQPLFLYEMIWNLIGFTLIFWLARRFEKKMRDGDIVFLYLIWYPLGRFFLEFFRTDSWFFPGTPFDLVHLLSAMVIVVSIILLITRHRNWSGRPVVAMSQDGSVALSEDEEEVVVSGSGIDMSEEYTFIGRHQQATIEAKDAEELAQEETLADEVMDEESEGIEDVEDWDGESPEEEIMLEEGEEYVEEENTIEDPEEAIKKAKEGKLEEPEEEEEEEEEPEEEEEDVTESVGENEEGVVGEEGGEESAVGEGETEEGGEESAVGEGEAEEGGEESAVGEGEAEEGGEGAEESGSDEGEAEDEAAGAEESSESADEGDAGDSSDE